MSDIENPDEISLKARSWDVRRGESVVGYVSEGHGTGYFLAQWPPYTYPLNNSKHTTLDEAVAAVIAAGA